MSSDNDYRPRVVDTELDLLLQAAGAVFIDGPKASGKTATALLRAKSVVSLDLDHLTHDSTLLNPRSVTAGEPPILINEWHLVPDVWNEVRHHVDNRAPAKGLFILTGSSTPNDDERRHSGAGRFARLQIRPMSIFEGGRSSGMVSLKDILDGKEVAGKGSDLSIPTLAELVCVGGWPTYLETDSASALKLNREYIHHAVEVDLPRLTKKRRDPRRLHRLLQSYARSIGTQVSNVALAKEAGGHEGPLDRNTVASYLEELTRLHLIEELPAWNTHLRCRAALTKSSKRFFVDPSLAVAALNLDPGGILKDLSFLGFLFENLVIRDLRVLSQPAGGTVFHARFDDDVKVDAVIELRDGTWAACEVELGGPWIDAGAANLKRWAARIDTTRAGEPAALMVIVPEGYCYKRPDGVLVVPLSALAP